MITSSTERLASYLGQAGAQSRASLCVFAITPSSCFPSGWTCTPCFFGKPSVFL